MEFRARQRHAGLAAARALAPPLSASWSGASTRRWRRRGRPKRRCWRRRGGPRRRRAGAPGGRAGRERRRRGWRRRSRRLAGRRLRPRAAPRAGRARRDGGRQPPQLQRAGGRLVARLRQLERIPLAGPPAPASRSRAATSSTELPPRRRGASSTPSSERDRLDAAHRASQEDLVRRAGQPASARSRGRRCPARGDLDRLRTGDRRAGCARRAAGSRATIANGEDVGARGLQPTPSSPSSSGSVAGERSRGAIEQGRSAHLWSPAHPGGGEAAQGGAVLAAREDRGAVDSATPRSRRRARRRARGDGQAQFAELDTPRRPRGRSSPAPAGQGPVELREARREPRHVGVELDRVGRRQRASSRRRPLRDRGVRLRGHAGLS